jgi:hypothetical protein
VGRRLANQRFGGTLDATMGAPPGAASNSVARLAFSIIEIFPFSANLDCC